MQSSTDVASEEIQVIVVPQCKRLNIIRLAHDKLGHLGYNKVIKIIMRNFVWPKLASDVKKYCEMRIFYLKGNISGQRKAPTDEHPVISQPFELVVLDIVGPLPTGKGRCKIHFDSSVHGNTLAQSSSTELNNSEVSSRGSYRHL